MLDYDKINAFLYFGYVPEPDPVFLRPITDDVGEFRHRKATYENQPVKETIREGGKILKRAIRDVIPSGRRLHVVPLSSGLDSRAILAHLVEAGLKDDIVAVTYGTPGTLDYEISKKVAAACGVRHELFDLTQIPIRDEDLRYAYDTGGAWTCLVLSYYNRLAFRRFGEDAVYWIGYLGDPIAGSHFNHAYPSMTWQEAQQLFLRKNRWVDPAILCLPDDGYNPARLLPERPFIEDPGHLSYPEQLDLSVRQTCWIRKAVLGNLSGVVPFTDTDWVKFSLAQYPSRRNGCLLYKSILYDRFPALFDIPSKTQGGGRIMNFYAGGLSNRIRHVLNRFEVLRNRTNRKRNMNYIDFASGYRGRDDLVALACEKLALLEQEEVVPWLRPMDLLKRHQAGQEELAMAIQLLVSLQMNIECDLSSES